LAFICLGPTTQHFSKVIRLGGSKFDDPVTKKKGSRAAMRKEEEKRNVVDRVVGIERGVSQQSQTTFGLMAQNEESAVQAHRDMRMTGIMKRIENNTELIKIRMSLWKSLTRGK
jgi:high-affinity K+ transport system ATPase subunit B